MGLPLFVAKVESDIPDKASGKHDVLAPNNAGVQPVRSRARRSYLGDDQLTLREARWQIERNRRRSNLPAMRQMRSRTRTGSRPLGDSIQVVAAPSPPTLSQADLDGLAAHISDNDAIDTAMDEFLRLDSRIRGAYAESLQDLLGSRWNQEGLRARARILSLRNVRAHPFTPNEVQGRSSDSLGTWTAEPRPQARRARVVGDSIIILSGHSTNNHQVSPVLSGDESLSPIEVLELRRLTDYMQQDRRLAESVAQDRGATRTRTTRPNRGIDGLGDRQRSMSPEMWDTLLSTMTPDPEPPSVSSSFASFPTSQSHNTNASSFSVPDSGPRAAEGFLPEPPRDSACEDSDAEDPAAPNGEQSSEHRIESRRDGPSEGFSVRRRHPEAERRAIIRGEPNLERGSGTNDDTLSHGFPRRHQLRVGWVGQLSVGAADAAGPSNTAGRGSHGQVQPALHQDDWSGMQLIVQRLAHREDIPDEWWLEAGLSRTLGDDGEMQ